MNSESPSREYRQTARAKAAEETGKRIIEAFGRALATSWYDEIRLDDIAQEAGVTVQTVIRRFGSKEGLLNAHSELQVMAIMEGRRVPSGEAARSIDKLIAGYEAVGPMVMRILAQEERYEAVMSLAETGRILHRESIGEVFAPWLNEFEGQARRDAHDRLVIATDLYVWKLLRVDMKRPVATLRRTMIDMCAQALGIAADDLEKGRATPTKKPNGN